MRTALLSAVTFSCFFALQAQDLPSGTGKAQVENICGSCHGVDLFSSNKLRRADWESVVDSMKARGADGSEADFKAIISYLTRFLGEPINVNKAEARTLQSELELTGEEAGAIVAHRKDKGDFKTFADLEKVSGLDIKKLEPIKARIQF